MVQRHPTSFELIVRSLLLNSRLSCFVKSMSHRGQCPWIISRCRFWYFVSPLPIAFLKVARQKAKMLSCWLSYVEFYRAVEAILAEWAQQLSAAPRPTWLVAQQWYWFHYWPTTVCELINVVVIWSEVFSLLAQFTSFPGLRQFDASFCFLFVLVVACV